MPYIMRMPTLARKSLAAAPVTRVPSPARLEARIPSDLKDIIETAAILAGHTSVTDYLVQTLRESASRIVEDSRRSRLEASESSAFVRALLDPGAPAQALQTAFSLHREQVR